MFSHSHHKITQGNTTYFRLLVTNQGRARAQWVEAVVTKVVRGGKQVEPFLPSPLRWTHQGNSETVRDIQRNQPAYIDLVEFWGSKR